MRTFKDIPINLFITLVVVAVSAWLESLLKEHPYYFLALIAVVMFLSLQVYSWLKTKQIVKRMGIEKERWNRIKEEKIKQRQAYSNRKEKILGALLKMDEYLAGVVDSQTISAEQFMEAFKKVYRGMVGTLIVGTFTMIGKNKQRYLNYNMKLTINMLARINTVFKDYKLGTLVALNEDEYKELDKQLRELKTGLSLKIVNDINQVILYCQIVNCLRLINPNRPFWERIEIKNINQSGILAFKTSLSNSQWQIANIMDNARGQVAEDLDKYLLGE